MSKVDERVTVVENRELREIIHEMTEGCFLTKSEYMEIQAILMRAGVRIVTEMIRDLKK